MADQQDPSLVSAGVNAQNGEALYNAKTVGGKYPVARDAAGNLYIGHTTNQRDEAAIQQYGGKFIFYKTEYVPLSAGYFGSSGYGPAQYASTVAEYGGASPAQAGDIGEAARIQASEAASQEARSQPGYSRYGGAVSFNSGDIINQTDRKVAEQTYGRDYSPPPPIQKMDINSPGIAHGASVLRDMAKNTPVKSQLSVQTTAEIYNRAREADRNYLSISQGVPMEAITNAELDDVASRSGSQQFYARNYVSSFNESKNVYEQKKAISNLSSSGLATISYTQFTPAYSGSDVIPSTFNQPELFGPSGFTEDQKQYLRDHPTNFTEYTIISKNQEPSPPSEQLLGSVNPVQYTGPSTPSNIAALSRGGTFEQFPKAINSPAPPPYKLSPVGDITKSLIGNVESIESAVGLNRVVDYKGTGNSDFDSFVSKVNAAVVPTTYAKLLFYTAGGVGNLAYPENQNLGREYARAGQVFSVSAPQTLTDPLTYIGAGIMGRVALEASAIKTPNQMTYSDLSAQEAPIRNRGFIELNVIDQNGPTSTIEATTRTVGQLPKTTVFEYTQKSPNLATAQGPEFRGVIQPFEEAPSETANLAIQRGIRQFNSEYLSYHVENAKSGVGFMNDMITKPQPLSQPPQISSETALAPYNSMEIANPEAAGFSQYRYIGGPTLDNTVNVNDLYYARTLSDAGVKTSASVYEVARYGDNPFLLDSSPKNALYSVEARSVTPSGQVYGSSYSVSLRGLGSAPIGGGTAEIPTNILGGSGSKASQISLTNVEVGAGPGVAQLSKAEQAQIAARAVSLLGPGPAPEAEIFAYPIFPSPSNKPSGGKSNDGSYNVVGKDGTIQIQQTKTAPQKTVEVPKIVELTVPPEVQVQKNEAKLTFKTAPQKTVEVQKPVQIEKPARIEAQKTTSIQRPMTVNLQKPLEIQKTIQTEIQRPIEIQRPLEIQKTGQVQIQRPIITPIQRPIIPNPINITPPPPPPPYIPPPTGGGGIGFPNFGGGGGRTFEIKGSGPKKRYSPSLTAIVFNIRSSGRAPKITTGFELQPIYTGSRGKPNIPRAIKPFGKRK